MEEKTKKLAKRLVASFLGGLLIGLVIGAVVWPVTVEKVITPKPQKLTPVNHTIGRVEDLFIPFEYEDKQNMTFIHTENFTTMNIVIQPDRSKDTNVGYTHYIEINGSAEVKSHFCRVCDGIEQTTFEIIDLKYGESYTLSFYGGCGVAVAG